MAEETVNETGKPPVEAVKPVAPDPAPANKYPVSIPIFAGAAASVIIALIKDKWGVDFSAQEGNIIVLVMGAAAFFTHRQH